MGKVSREEDETTIGQFKKNKERKWPFLGAKAIIIPQGGDDQGRQFTPGRLCK